MQRSLDLLVHEDNQIKMEPKEITFEANSSFFYMFFLNKKTS